MTKQEAILDQLNYNYLKDKIYAPPGKLPNKIESIGSWCFGSENDWFPVIQFLEHGNDLYTNIKAHDATQHINV